MSKEQEEIDRAAAQLSQELAYTHDAFMAVHRFLAEHENPDVQLNCMNAAARLMQAQAAVALSLKRLRSNETAYAFRYIHEGVPPTPQKSKTNGPAAVESAAVASPGAGRIEEVWEEVPELKEGEVEEWDVDPRDFREA